MRKPPPTALPTALLTRCLFALVAAPLLLAGGFGCATGTPVEITSAPGNASLTVYDAGGAAVAKGRSPLTPRLDLKDGKQYRVEADPLGETAEFYEPTVATLDSSSVVRAGPEAKEGTFAITLPNRDNVMVPTWVPVYHPRDGWVALRTRLRSYQSVLETDGREPERVKVLGTLIAEMDADVRRERERDRTKADMPVGDVTGVWGLDVRAGAGGAANDDDAEVIVSLFAAGRPLAVPAEDAEAARRIRQVQARRRGKDPVRVPDFVDSQYRHELRESKLTTVSVATGSPRDVTDRRQADLEPAYMVAPDERTGLVYVLFSTNREREKSSWLYRVPADNRAVFGPLDRSDPVHGTTTPSHAQSGAVAFSFVPATATGLADAKVKVLLDGPGGLPSDVTDGTHPRISPVEGADGGQIAYVRNNELWINNTSVGGALQVTDMLGDNLVEQYRQRSLASDADRRRFDDFEEDWVFPAVAWPAWSPDGEYLCYSALTEDEQGRPNYDVWIVRRDGRYSQRVTANGSADIYPRFGPDGRSIYFLSNRGFNVASPSVPAWTVWRHDISDVLGNEN